MWGYVSLATLIPGSAFFHVVLDMATINIVHKILDRLLFKQSNITYKCIDMQVWLYSKTTDMLFSNLGKSRLKTAC